jgi:hypothetical protein
MEIFEFRASIFSKILAFFSVLMIVSCASKEEAKYQTVYSAEADLSVISIPRVKDLFASVAQKKGDVIDSGEVFSRAAGVDLVYIDVIALEDSTISADNLPDKSKLFIMVVAKKPPKYLPEFKRKLETELGFKYRPVVDPNR